jgi:hypothetical protein
VLAVAPAALPAQCGVCDEHEPRLRGEAVTLLSNALLGGVTVGVRRALAGGSFGDAFAAGAAGGALTYAGKRIAVEGFAGAGLLGREVAAVGSSVSRNAADGRAPLETVMLPAGPVRLYLGGGAPVRARLDLAAVAAAAYTSLQPGARLDAGESLSSGALVFRREGAPDEVGFNGMQLAGVVQVRWSADTLGGPPDDFQEQLDRIARHERVHVLQYDQGFLLWAAPAEEALLSRAGWTRGVHRWVDLGLHLPVQAGLSAALPYEARPWELEAYFLSRTRAAPGADAWGAITRQE